MEYKFLVDTYETERIKTPVPGVRSKTRIFQYVQTQKTGEEETPTSTWYISV